MKKITTILAASIITLTACNDKRTSTGTVVETPVKVEEIKASSIKQFVNTTGTVMSVKEVLLKSEMTGKYRLQRNPKTGRTYAMGDKVKKGEVIIKLEDKEYENGIAIDAKKLDLDIKKQNFTKQKSLHKKGGVTLLDLRNSEVALINSKYSYENAQLSLDKMSIKAPFDGVLVDIKYYTEGTKVASGSDMISMMDYSKMHMEFNLPAKNITQINKRQDVLITNYNLPNDTLSGSVSEISPAISTETRTFKGKIVVNNPDLTLRPGMFVNADIVTQESKNTIVIPKDIITTNRGKKYVFIVDKKTAKQVKIRTALENKNFVEVKKGLNMNDRIVISGYQTLRDRSKVKVIR